MMEPHMIVKIIFITCLRLNSIMWVSSVNNFIFNGLMEPHMTDNYTCLCI